MKSKRVQVQKWAYKFTKPTIMKFQPLQDFDDPSQVQSTSLLNRIKTFFSPPSKTKTMSPPKRPNSNAADVKLLLNKKQIAKKPLLKYVKRLTNDHVLIGNEDQLDAMCISGIIHEFVDTEYLWSLNIKRAIMHMAIDYKKNYIVLLPENEVLVYSFDPKLIHNKPHLIGTFQLVKEVKFVQVVKDSTFILCYLTGVEVYSIDEAKGIRPTMKKNYDIPEGNHLNLLQIPVPYENILNIFFEEKYETTTSFGLWNIEVQFSQKDIKMSKAQKVYDIPGFLKKYVRLENYSKDIYLINLGREIFAVRKGYVIDSANVDISFQNNYLKYISHQKLMHVSDIKAEIYQFKVDTTVHPPRIGLSSMDSIQIPELPKGYEYVDAVEILGQNFAIFYQTKQEENKMMKGELKYGFVVSHLVKMEDKINEILPQAIGNVNIETIKEKADMVKKMGLERKDIYLRLWNNSQKTEVEDYKILLDTLDYDTIKLEIEKKLKKASMSLRQMILLEQGCLAMLHESVYGPQTNKQDIKNYFISHLIIRKLQLYKLISMIDKKQGKAITEDQQGKLLINIQNYNYYKTVCIKSMLYELISTYCNEEKNVIMKIRVVLKYFKFSLRINYQEILQEIISKTKKKFLKILEAIPQLLPYDKTDNVSEEEDMSFYEGMWCEITPQEWQKHLYIDNVLTIDNKQVLAEVCSNVWFKRYWLSQHQYINFNRKQIQAIHKENCSDVTFYNVIEKIFDNVKDYPSVKALLDFIQDKYEKLPQHLFGKIFLYRKLFEQFKENQKITKIEGNVDNFKDFLKMKDQDIFKVMFNFEKVKKNFILKEMKPLYLKLAGNEVFNEGLLSYFASDKSETSDIKYLLNRMNNEKKEFHEENEGIYEVLVRGMQLKLKLGSKEDIPIDQVLIYIENIPLSEQNPIMKDLQTMRLINEESARFKKIKLNMSIFEMMKNVDNVIASLIIYQINQANVKEMRSYAQIQDITHRIISDVQDLKQKIFSNSQYNELVLFTYLTSLLQQQQLISIVGILIEDQWINSNFTLNQIMLENLSLYMYKWKLNNNPNYTESGPYLKELVNLLPTGNKVRQYIQAQIQFSELLSSPQHSIYYPLSNGNQYFTIIQLESIINHTPPAHLLTVNIERLYECSLKIQQISTDNELSQIKLHDVYEMIIERLIQCDMLREVIQKIRTLIEIQGPSPFNYIYPSLLVAKIAPELIDENRNLLLRCSSYLFNNPNELLEILEKLMSIKATSDEYKRILNEYYEKNRKVNLTFSQNSPVLEKLYLKLLDTDELKNNYMIILRRTLLHILSLKEEFSRKPEFFIIFTILCNDPYVLVKYFYCNKYIINIKDFRCFLSYLIKDEIFNKQNLLQFGKRLFFILYEWISKNKSIQLGVEQFKKLPLEISREIDRIKETKSDFESKLSKSLDRLKFKIKSVSLEVEKKKAKGSLEPEENKLNRFRERLLKPKIDSYVTEYPFLDSDDSPKNPQLPLKKQERKSTNIESFDSKYERHALMKRTVKDIGLYVSIQKQRKEKSLYYTQKFVNDGIFGSLHIDKRIENVLQNAINLAFRQSANNNKRKLRIGKVTSEYVDLNTFDLAEQIEKMSNRRSKAVSHISEQDLQEIQKMEETIIKEEKTPQVGNIIAQAIIINQILNQKEVINENTKFDFSLLQPYKSHQQFPNFLKEIIRLVYEKNMPFKGVLLFIKSLSQACHELTIHKQWLEIYIRAENLQYKFNLDLQLRNILKIDGLFIESQISERLFNYLLPFIVSYSNDQNIMKVCKVITLAFRKPDLEQEILYRYLIELFNKYERSMYQPTMSEKQLKMQREKIYLIINKIPIKLLISREEEIIKHLPEENIRKEIIGLLVTSFRRRYDQKSADYMQDKWINKRKNVQLEP